MWDIARIPSVRHLVTDLGYPTYFLVLLGTWKVLGVALLLLRALLGSRWRPPVALLRRYRIRVDDTLQDYIADARWHPRFRLHRNTTPAAAAAGSPFVLSVSRYQPRRPRHRRLA